MDPEALPGWFGIGFTEEMMSEVVAYIGTTDDLIELSRSADQYSSRSLGLPVGGGIMDGVRAIHVDQADPERLFVGTNTGGVVRSLDAGTSWQAVNEGITYKNIWCITQHPATGDLYVGTEPASVFRSSDGGDTWVDLPSLRQLPGTKQWWFPMPPHVAHVRHIGLRDDDPDDLFCAVEDGWLVRSRDGGVTWEELRDGVHCDAHSVTFKPGDPSVVFVASGDYGYRSTDGGETFVDARTGMDRGYMTGVVSHPDRPGALLAVSAHPPGAWFRPGAGAETAIYTSDDFGASWRRVRQGLPDDERWGTWAFAGDPADADHAYLGLFDGRIWATTDGGDTFSEVTEVEGPILTMVCGRRG